MTDVCQLHAEFRKEVSDINKALGRVEGRQEEQLRGISEIKDNINELYSSGNATKQEQAIQKTKLSPFFWFLTIVIGSSVMAVVTSVITHFWSR